MSRSAVEPRQRSPSSYVLDSFALLAWLQDEPGADTVQTLLERAKHKRIQIYVSWINIAEVYYVAKRRSTEADPRLAADKVIEVIEKLPIQIESISKTEAVAAGRLKADHAISLADAFAAALAKTYHAQVVTGDPEFESLDRKKEVPILWLPTKSKGIGP